MKTEKWLVKVTGTEPNAYYSVVHEGDFDDVAHTKENIELMADAPRLKEEVESLKALLGRIYFDTINVVPMDHHAAIPAYKCPLRDFVMTMKEAAKLLGKPEPFQWIKG